MTVSIKCNNKIDYFLAGTEKQAHMERSENLTKSIHQEFADVFFFSGIGCFKGTFSLQKKDGAKPYQALPRCIACGLQGPFKKELNILQEGIIITLGVGEMAK